MNVAIIASSTKSERIPDKNISLVDGKPMIVYPIEAALASGMFDQVIVSTADEKTAQIVKQAGAKVYPSPAGLQRKKNTVANCCHSVLNVLLRDGGTPEFFCNIFATAIFLNPSDFIDSSKLLDHSDYVMGVSKFVYEPEHAMVMRDGYLDPVNRRSLRYKAPSFPTKYSSNGTIAWCRVESFMHTRGFYGPRLLGYEIPRSRVVDINTPEDLDLARILMNSKSSR